MQKKWWMEAVGYEIYPRSFKDSNGDGIGDIPGIISKLDYLKDLGITLIWVCPIYQSPMDDNGYDVSDFFNIAKDFGTLEDAKKLIEQAHLRGIKVVLDLVLNHTSDEHPWFIESRKSINSPYRNYYYWREGKKNAKGERIPPTNWASFFEGSAWNYDPKTEQYYMKIFSNKMPDLNWSNPELRKKLYGVATWWLDLGVDGFRVDAIAHIARDQTFSDGVETPGRGLSHDWSKFSNHPEAHTYLKEMYKEVFSKYDCMTVGEFGGGAKPTDALFYSGYDSHELNMTFTFDHCWSNGAFGADQKSDDEIKTDVISLKDNLDKWQTTLFGKAWNPLYWLNHDHPRVMSQYGEPKNYHTESGKMLCNTLYCLWGTPFVYNGEEIGMTNGQFQSFDDFKDVWVKGYVEDARKRGITDAQILRHLTRTTRDNARTPMQWDDSPFAGFSTHKPWINNVPNFKSINVAKQMKDPNSLWNHYKKVLHLRHSGPYKNVIIYGRYQLLLKDHPSLFVYLRQDDFKTLLVVSNFTKNQTQVNLPEYQINRVVVQNYPKTIASLKNYTLEPFESFVLDVTPLTK